MTYDVIMITLIIACTTGMVWASRQMAKAAKEGKIRYIGKVQIESKRSSGVDKP